MTFVSAFCKGTCGWPIKKVGFTKVGSKNSPTSLSNRRVMVFGSRQSTPCLVASLSKNCRVSKYNQMDRINFDRFFSIYNLVPYLSFYEIRKIPSLVNVFGGGRSAFSTLPNSSYMWTPNNKTNEWRNWKRDCKKIKFTLERWCEIHFENANLFRANCLWAVRIVNHFVRAMNVMNHLLNEINHIHR